jgi:hypothetical protein
MITWLGAWAAMCAFTPAVVYRVSAEHDCAGSEVGSASENLCGHSP